MLSKLKKLLSLVAFVALWAGMAPAHAGLQSELQNMFDGMVNVTNAQAYEGQGRGVLSGGAINMRFKVVRPNIVSFTPPSIKAGCGGIDLVGGSLSFINLQAFIDLAKNIAQNAAGYAFGLAIEAMCPTCAQEMKSLQEKIQQLNQFMGNSCAMAKKLVNMTNLDEWRDERVTEARNKRTQGGGAVDSFGSWLKSKTDGMLDGLDAPTQNAMEYNVVWKSMDSAGMGAWFASGADDTMKRVFMSLTGTVVFMKIQDQDGKNQIAPFPKKPRINFQHILQGSPTGEIPDVYNCSDSDCITMSTGSATFKGMKNLVNEMMFGSTDDSMVVGGIVSKINSRSSDFTAREKAFIAASRPPILAILRDVATDKAALTYLAKELTEVIAIETSAQFVLQAIDAVEAAVTGKWKQENGAFIEDLRIVRANAYREISRAHEALASLKNKQEVAHYATAVLRRHAMARVRPEMVGPVAQ